MNGAENSGKKYNVLSIYDCVIKGRAAVSLLFAAVILVAFGKSMFKGAFTYVVFSLAESNSRMFSPLMWIVCAGVYTALAHGTNNRSETF